VVSRQWGRLTKELPLLIDGVKAASFTFPEQASKADQLLSAHVAAGTITKPTADLLCEHINLLGIIGIAEALRGVNRLPTLGSDEQGQFLKIVAAAPSDTHRAFLWKELSKGSAVVNIAAFAKAIEHIGQDDLVSRLNLHAPLALQGGPQIGLRQQGATCCATVGFQVVRSVPSEAELLRRLDPDIHSADNYDPMARNPLAAHIQRELMHAGEGELVPRLDSTLDDEYGPNLSNGIYTASAWMTGYTLNGLVLPSDADRDPLFARAKEQAFWGVPTILYFNTPQGTGGHAVPVTQLFNPSSDNPVYVTHDPWKGLTAGVSEADLRQNKHAFGGSAESHAFGLVVATGSERDMPVFGPVPWGQSADS
jgi:hypothetical protein